MTKFRYNGKDKKFAKQFDAGGDVLARGDAALRGGSFSDNGEYAAAKRNVLANDSRATYDWDDPYMKTGAQGGGKTKRKAAADTEGGTD